MLRFPLGKAPKIGEHVFVLPDGDQPLPGLEKDEERASGRSTAGRSEESDGGDTLPGVPGMPKRLAADGVSIELGDSLELCGDWPTPDTIVVDGPYGVNGFRGDPPTCERLAQWYAPHAAAWAKAASNRTTLWFWGTERSWATVHTMLEMHGWDYRAAHIWDKGKAHIAGNVNGNTIRRFPQVTEVCVLYERRVMLRDGHGELLPMKEWLRSEWRRAGLPLAKTNDAAGVRNAATRKWFTLDHNWYPPPPDMMERLAFHARRHGKSTDHPYFSLDGRSQLTAEQWSGTRPTWNHHHGVTNVWKHGPLHGDERVKDEQGKYVHANQKPLALTALLLEASTQPGDTVWEPFGGLCTTALAALQLGRKCFAAEIDPVAYRAATARLAQGGALRRDSAA